MTHMRRIYPLLLVSALLCACGRSGNDTTASRYEIPTKVYSLSRSALEGADPSWEVSGNYLILSGEPDNRRLSSIEKMLITGDKMILRDKATINIYDKQGRYLSSVSYQGKANNEYMELGDISCHRGELYILDGSYGKLLRYDSCGRLLSARTLPLNDLNGMAVLDSRYIFYRPLYSSDDDLPEYRYALTYTDTSLNILHQEIRYTENSPGISNGSPFIENDERLFFHQFLTDRYSSIDRNTGAVRTYGIDFGTDSISVEDLKEPQNIFAEKSNKRYLTTTPFFHRNYLIVTTAQNRIPATYCIDTASGTIHDISRIVGNNPACVGFDTEALYFPCESESAVPDSVKQAYESGRCVLLEIQLPQTEMQKQTKP